MALDTRLPLEVLRPDQIAQTTLKTNLMSKQNALAGNDVAQIPVDNELKKLEVAKRQADVTVQLLSGATDQNTWLANKQKAASLGLDVSNVPDQYDPQIKNQLMMSTLSIKDRLELQLQEAQAGIKAEDRLYDRSKDARQFGLEERKVRAAEMENMITPMGINPAAPPLGNLGSSAMDFNSIAPITESDLNAPLSTAPAPNVALSMNNLPPASVEAQALPNINDPVAPLSEVPFQSKKGQYVAAPGAPGYALKMDGTAAPIPGVPVKNDKFTEGQANAAGFADRIALANAELSNIDNQGSDLMARMKSGAPFVGNYLQSPEYQKFDQAKRNFINAQLRRESGAAIANSEFENADKQYFPVPGDSGAVIEQKRLNRQMAEKSMVRSAGPAYKKPENKIEASAPEIGTEEGGYVFIGGDPSKPESWKPK